MSSDINSIYSQGNLNLPKTSDSRIYEFDRFRLDAARRMLYENGQPVALAPKVVETLVVLIEFGGDVVGKEDLMNRLWAGSSVEESNLTQNVYLLRKTLGQTADGKPMIETYRRRGYRFNGRIKEFSKNEKIERAETENLIESDYAGTSLDANAANEWSDFSREKFPSAGEAVFDQPAKTRPIAESRNKIRYTLGAAAFCLLVLAIFGEAWFFGAGKADQTQTASRFAAPNPNFKIARLTPDVHAESPTVSPDGKTLVYAKTENNKRSVWLTDIATGGAKQIMPPTEGGYDAFQFSPDGSEIYLVIYQQIEPKFTVARIPLAGGAPQTIAENIMSPFTLSPDGKHLAFVRDQELTIAETDGGGERVLARRDRKTGWFESWGSQLSWSPDGERIAICGGRVENGKARRELIEVSLKDGGETIIPTPPDWAYIDDVQWLPDESGLLVNASETSGSPLQIWLVSYPSGEIRRITQDFLDYDWLSVSADSRLLIAHQRIKRYNVWTADFAGGEQAKQLTFGAKADDGFWGVAASSDGRIVYTSPRSGNLDLWVMNADGSNQRQLTAGAGDDARPIFTPDNRRVVFRSTRAGLERIWRVDADGANPKQLTDGDGYQTQPIVSPDGNWVYYIQVEGESGDIWRVSIDGGTPIRVSTHGRIVRLFSVSPDGKLLVFEQYRAETPIPWQIGLMRADDGKVVKLFENKMNGRVQWTADSKSLIYVDPQNYSNLLRQPIEGGEARPITDFDSQQIRAFEVTPDWQTIVFSRGNTTSEAVSITDFR